MQNGPNRAIRPSTMLMVAGVCLAVLGVVLVVSIGALGLLLFGPALAVFAVGLALARPRTPRA
jgi:hypothetical protein